MVINIRIVNCTVPLYYVFIVHITVSGYITS